MTAPVVTQRVETPFGTATDPQIPFTANTGDLVIVFLTIATAQTISLSDSFTNWTNNNANSHMFYKIIDGTEGGNVLASVTTNCKAAAVAYTIQAGTFAQNIPPVSSTVATGTSQNPNATIVSPTGSAKDYLYLTWFYSAGEEADDDTWVSVTPTSYSNTVQVTSGTASTAATNCSLASAEYASTATTSQDASAWTMAQSLAWRAYTIAIYPLMTGSFTANAITKRAQTGSFSADAILRRPQSDGFFADAIKVVGVTTVSSSVPGNAILLREQAGATTADAIALREMAWTISADAIALRVQEFFAATDATILRTQTGADPADAIIQREATGDAPADAILHREQSASLGTDAIVLRTIGPSIFADAIVRSLEQTIEALLYANAITGKVGRCVWTYPAPDDHIETMPEMRFLMPQGTSELYFWLELDRADTFDTEDLRQYRTTTDVTGWSYWDGNSWEAITAAGVPNVNAGYEARFIVPTPLISGLWYRRVRAGVR